MSDATTLKEFLVAIGWKNDDVAMRKAIDSIEKIGKKLAELATVATATATGAVYALDKMAQSFEKAYYQSARTGSSVREIRSFSYAVSQLGGNAEDAVAALESLSVKLKTNPNGFRAQLRNVGGSVGVGIDTEHGTEKAMEGLSVAMSKMDSLHQRMWAGELGINETLLNAIVNYKEIQKYQAEYVAKSKAMGIDLQQAANDGKSLAQSFRTLGLSFSLLFDRIGSKLFRDLDEPLKRLGEYIDRHGDEIAQVVTDIAKALLAMFSYIIEHLPDIERFVKSIGGWNVVLTALGVLLVARVLGPLGSFFGLLSAITKIVPPGWLLGLIGTAGALGGIAGASMNYGESQGFSPEVNSALAAEGAKGGGGSLMGRVKRRLGFGGGNDALRRRGHGADISLGRNGNLSANQKEAYAAAVAEGLSVKAARALVANMSGEGLANDAHRVHWDGKHFAHGIVQWDDVRSAAIKRQFGKAPEEMSVAEQTRAAIWEMKNNPRFGKTWRALQGDNAGDMIGALVGNYESPADVGGAISKRTQIYRGLGGLGSAPGASFKMPNVSNPMAINPYSFAPTLGLGGAQSMNDNRIHMAPSTTINVSGVGDPHAAAAQVASNMTRQHSTLLRNLQSAIG